MKAFESWLVRKPAGPKPRKALKRTGRPKKVSKKHSKRLREYFKLRADYLAKNAACEAGPVILGAKLPEFYHVPRCEVWSTEVHHTKRRGPHLNDVESFCGTCRTCHQWVHQHTQKSKELGLLAS